MTQVQNSVQYVELAAHTLHNPASLRLMLKKADQLIPDLLIQKLNLEPILVKLKLEKNWSWEKLLTHYLYYKQFLFLCKTQNTTIVPTPDLDDFWHSHIEDNEKYEKDCQSVFGKILYHFPYLGLRSKNDANILTKKGKLTRKLLSTSFGIQSWSGVENALCGSDNCAYDDDGKGISKRRPKIDLLFA